MKRKAPEKPEKPKRPPKPTPHAVHEQEIPLDADRWSGFRDSFGEREVGIDADGSAIELLRLAREFTPVEEAIANRIARLAKTDRPGVARPLRLEHDDQKRRARLVLVSERVPGVRLSDALTRGVSRAIVPDIGAALYVMRRLFATAESLRAATRVPHFIIAPERVILTPRADIVITEAALAGGIEALTTVSNAFRLALADVDAQREIHRVDVARIARIGIAMMLGRMVEPDETVDALSPALNEVTDVASIRAGDQFSKALGAWFEQAVTIDAGVSFVGFRQASAALVRTNPPKDCVASRATLRIFLNDLALDELRSPDVAALEADRIRMIRSKQTARRTQRLWDRVASELGLPHKDEILQESPEEIAAKPLRPAAGAAPPPPPAGAARAGAETGPIKDSVLRTVASRFGFLLRDETAQKPTAEPTAEEIVEQPPTTAPEPVAQAEPPVVEPPVEAAALSAAAQVSEEVAPAYEEPVQPTEEEAPASELPAPVAEIAAPAEEIPAEWIPPGEEPGVPKRQKRSWFRSVAKQLGIGEEAATSEPGAAPAEETLDVAAQQAAEAEAHRVAAEAEARRAADAETQRLAAEAEVERMAAEAVARRRAAEEDAQRRAAEEEARRRAEEEARRAAEAEARRRAAEEEARRAAEAEAARRAAEEEARRLAEEARRAAEAQRLAEEEARRAAEAEARRRAAEEEARRAAEAEARRKAAEEEARRAAEAEARRRAAERTAEEEARKRAAEEEARRVAEAEARRRAADEEARRAAEAEARRRAAEEEARRAAEAEAQRAAQEVEEEEVEAGEEEEPEEPESRASWLSSVAAEMGLKPDAQPPQPEPSTPANSWAPPAPPAPPLAAPPAPPTPAWQPPASPSASAWHTPPSAAPHASASAPQSAWQPPAPQVPGWQPPVYGTTPPPPPSSVAPSQPAASLHASAASPAAAWRRETADTAEPASEPKPAVKPRASRLPEFAAAASQLFRTAALLLIVAGVVGGLGWAGYFYYSTRMTSGTVVIESNPSGAEILIDGDAKGVTPLTIELSPGQHKLELRRRGNTRELALDVPAGGQVRQQIDLTNLKAIGTLVVNSSPKGAKVLVDGRERGVTPLTLTDVTAGAHKVTIESSDGSIEKSVQIEPGGKVTVDEGIFSGWIAVFAPVELQIFERKRLIGTTDNERIMLSAGRHELELVNSRLGFRETRSVDVGPGQTAALNVLSTEGTLRITAPAGAEVFIDGTRIGEAPLDEQRVVIGSREVLVRHPQLGEKKVTATVTSSAPAEVTVEFEPR